MEPSQESTIAIRRLVIVRPGPVHELTSTAKREMLRLSEEFGGYLLVTMPEPRPVKVGRFEFRPLRFHPNSHLLTNIRYLFHALGLAVRLKAQGKAPDLIVSYDPIRSGLIALAMARITGARFICEVNGVYNSDANYLDGGASYSSRLKRKLFPHIIRFVLERADGIKSLFPGQVDGFGIVVAQKPKVHFHSFVELSAFRNLGESKQILFVGFPFFLKGVDLLIEAFKRISPKYPEWELKIMGWFPDDRELRQAMDGHPRIRHQPPVLHSEIAAHIGVCGMLVLPSRTEAMGRVLLEAMACAKPRVGARIEGIPTVIEDEVDGLLFSPGSASELSEKLDRLMGDPALRRKLGDAGRRRLSRDFSEQAYFSQAFDFYRGVIENVPR